MSISQYGHYEDPWIQHAITLNEMNAAVGRWVAAPTDQMKAIVIETLFQGTRRVSRSFFREEMPDKTWRTHILGTGCKKITAKEMIKAKIVVAWQDHDNTWHSLLDPRDDVDFLPDAEVLFP